MVFPQFAKTTHPEVLAAVERNRQGVSDLYKKALSWSEKQGVEKGSHYVSRFGGSHIVTALGGAERPTTGQWKKHPRGGWRPFKNNPLDAEMLALRFDEESVPGLPSLVDGPYNDDMSHIIATPQPFVWDGAVYVGFSFPPVDNGSDSTDPADGGWEEIKASEFHTARESYNERISR